MRSVEVEQDKPVPVPAGQVREQFLHARVLVVFAKRPPAQAEQTWVVEGVPSLLMNVPAKQLA